MPGPPRTPSAIRRARGNRGHRAHLADAHEPQPAATTADAPRTLTGEARLIWETLAPECVRMGTLMHVDRLEFEKACRVEAEGRRRLGVLETGDRPDGRIEDTLRFLRQASAIFARFGIGAADRTKIHVTPAKPESKWQRLAS